MLKATKMPPDRAKQQQNHRDFPVLVRGSCPKCDYCVYTNKKINYCPDCKVESNFKFGYEVLCLELPRNTGRKLSKGK